MKNIHSPIVPVIVFMLFTLPVSADPPEPPVGKRWVLNEKFSDEFNGTELDLTKWYDHHPTWKGREPGIFLPSQVSVGDGYMTIRGEKLPADTIVTYSSGRSDTFNIACGAVVSRTLEAWFGYYECRFKAAKTTMSTTFWFSTRGRYDGPEECDDNYGLEWDVQECIGREGDFNGKYFAKGMHSNSHFWYSDCDGNGHDYRAEQVLFDSDELASEAFNIYGGWWHDETRASYYYNNSEVKSHYFYAEVKRKPFDRPMGLNLVSETYPYPWISLPTDEELADPEKNICYYDWVRAYRLVDVDEELPEGSVEHFMFSEGLWFAEDPVISPDGDVLSLKVSFKTRKDREILLELLDETGRRVRKEVLPALSGYGHRMVTLDPDQNLKGKGRYSARIYLRPSGAAEGTETLDQDSITF